MSQDAIDLDKCLLDYKEYYDPNITVYSQALETFQKINKEHVYYDLLKFDYEKKFNIRNIPEKNLNKNSYGIYLQLGVPNYFEYITNFSLNTDKIKITLIINNSEYDLYNGLKLLFFCCMKSKIMFRFYILNMKEVDSFTFKFTSYLLEKQIKQNLQYSKISTGNLLYYKDELIIQ